MFCADPSGANAVESENGFHFTGQDAHDFARALQNSMSLADQNQGKGKIFINNSQTPKGAYFKINANVEMGIQSKQGTKLFGVGEKIDVGASVKVAKA